MAEVTARISRKEGDENDSDRGQQLIHGKEEAGEAPVKDKCRKKLPIRLWHSASELQNLQQMF